MARTKTKPSSKTLGASILGQKKAASESGKETGTIRGRTGASKSVGKRAPKKVPKSTKTKKKKRRKNSDTASDGGLVALAGYVNQMLGSAADFAICLSGQANDAGGFKTLIRFETEVHGQDSSQTVGTAENQMMRILKQYKYSANPEKHPIGPSELKKIITTLRRSATKASKTQEMSTELVLCTNRPFSTKVQKSPAYKSIGHELYEPSKAINGLKSYALRFGTFSPADIDDGVRRVIYYLFHVAISHSQCLTKLRFEENLIGHNEPRSIVVADAIVERRKELNNLGANHLRLVPERLAHREAVKGTTDWMNDAIIVFVGDGGCGKTTALWQILREAVDIQPPHKLAQMMIPQGHYPPTFGAIVEYWRGNGSGANGASDDLGLERLKRANSGFPQPIVLLGLDGIDETNPPSMRNDTTARVLSFFWDLHVRARIDETPPPARLFVSCRRESTLKRLLPDPMGLGQTELTPRYVYFGDFTNKELSDLARQDSTVDHQAADLIAQSLMGDFEPTGTGFGPPAFTLPKSSVSREKVDLLRHPILWRSFTLLDAAAQNGVLAGSREAQDKLGAAFLKWFCERIAHRINIEVGYVPIALRYLANTCHDSTATYGLDRWLQCVQHAAGFTQGDAKSLYQECLSSGIVQDIAPSGGPVLHGRSWRWKHVFLAEYFKESVGK